MGGILAGPINVLSHNFLHATIGSMTDPRSRELPLVDVVLQQMSRQYGDAKIPRRER